MGFTPPSPKQVKYLKTLITTRRVNTAIRDSVLQKLENEELSAHEVGRMIAKLRHKSYASRWGTHSG